MLFRSGADDSIGREVALGRHHHRKFGRELPVTRATQLFHEAQTQLWRALVNVAPVGAIECGLEKVHHCAGAEKRPVLSGFEEDVRSEEHTSELQSLTNT